MFCDQKQEAKRRGMLMMSGDDDSYIRLRDQMMILITGCINMHRAGTPVSASNTHLLKDLRRNTASSVGTLVQSPPCCSYAVTPPRSLDDPMGMYHDVGEHKYLGNVRACPLWAASTS